MKKLTLVVDERELRTIRAALFLLQEQVDTLLEDLAEMLAEHGRSMSVSNIGRLSLWFDELKSLMRDSADQDFSQTRMVVEDDRFIAASIAQGPA
jgi:site-specific recombinase